MTIRCVCGRDCCAKKFPSPHKRDKMRFQNSFFVLLVGSAPLTVVAEWRFLIDKFKYNGYFFKTINGY